MSRLDSGPASSDPLNRAGSSGSNIASRLRLLGAAIARLDDASLARIQLSEQASNALDSLILLLVDSQPATHSFNSQGSTPSVSSSLPLSLPDTLSVPYLNVSPTPSLPSTSQSTFNSQPYTFSFPSHSAENAFSSHFPISHNLPSSSFAPPLPQQSTTRSLSASSTAPSFSLPGQSPEPELVGCNVKVTTKLTLEFLYRVSTPNAILEFPKTSKRGIGYLARVSTPPGEKWLNPARNFAYSLGGGRGFSNKETQRIPLLVDSNTGEMVTCKVAFQELSLKVEELRLALATIPIN
ncbi:hypothetical protein NMY22_g13549 [Coprinellus aureogranulatus]|nr:hypothetical protein NMY22_g13549 [Coprinellus aureogranulatus]